MKKASYERKTCRLCNKKRLKKVLHLKPSPIADSFSSKPIKQPSFRLDWMLCQECGNVQLRDIVDPSLIYVNYLYKTDSSLGLVNHFNKYARTVLHKLKLKPNSLVIDIGSNDGSLLKSFRENSMKVLGIDPAKEIAQEATQNGIPTIPDFFTEDLALQILSKYGKAAIITANNIVANVDDLDSFMSAVKLIMDNDGVFIFESFYILDIIKNMVFDCTYHEHLNYFSVNPVKKFFEKHQMELIDSTSVSTKGGSVRYMAQLIGGKRKISGSVKTHIISEQKYNLANKSAYTRYSKKINTCKTKTLRLLLPFLKKNSKIAAFGASPSSTTLLYEFDLVDKIDFFLDDNPAKFNTYCPGTNIPVYETHHVSKNPPDLIIILAWRYAESVIRRHTSLFGPETKFLLPLPIPKILK